MAIPRVDGNIAARVKALEDKLRRIQLVPSTTQTDVAPLAVAKGAVWIDSSAGNEPKVWDGTAWVPVRDETIAAAQTTADQAVSDVTPLVPLTDLAGATSGTTITGTTQSTSGSGPRVVINDPSYPGEIVLYTDNPDEAEPARIKPVVSPGTSYLWLLGPRLTTSPVPTQVYINDDSIVGRGFEVDADRFRVFATDTKIDGYGAAGVQIGDGSDYVSIAGKVITNADLSSGTNTFPTSLLTATGTQTVTNKDLSSATNTFPTNAYFYGYLNANQSIPNVTGTTVTGWVADGSPNSSGITHSSGIFTVPTAGRYRLRAHLWWAAQASPAGTRTASWISVSPSAALASDATPPSSLAATPNYVEKTVRLAAGQQVLVQLTQTQGAAVNLIGTGPDITYVQIEWVGP